MLLAEKEGLRLEHNELEIHKSAILVEDILTEMGKKLVRPIRRVASIAVIQNPYSGGYTADLSVLYDFGEMLAKTLAKNALKALEVEPEAVESYGKGAIVGTAGEIEHGHAIIHPKFGSPVREALGGREHSKAGIPSTVKIGAPGTHVDIPLQCRMASLVRSHYDSFEVNLADAPKCDEILIALAMSNGGRPLARIGGLQKEQVKGLNGIR
jgi:hypothetical protein